MKWDYLIVRVVDEAMFVDEALWEEGDKGWELVCAVHTGSSVRLYFKRPLS